MKHLQTRNKAANGIQLQRPNKIARGMTETFNRAHSPAFLGRAHKGTGKHSDIAGRLSVRGTLDKLHGLSFCVKRLLCPCCRSTNAGPLVLNDHGRLRLRAARRRAGGK